MRGASAQTNKEVLHGKSAIAGWTKGSMDSGTLSKPEDGDPAYWFEQYWLHRLYCDGVEKSMESIHKYGVPHLESNDAITGEPATLFHWEVMYKLYNLDQPLPSFRAFGKRLRAKVKSEGSEDYTGIVEARVSNASEGGSPVFRLYASRNFEKGDAIIFFSEYEEKCGVSILGGIHVRTVDDPSECNVYLTQNRTLRGKRYIQKGEEIIRCCRQQKIASLEAVDRAVVCLNKMIVGRVSAFGYMIHYSNPDNLEPGKPQHVQLLRNLPAFTGDAPMKPNLGL